MRTMFGKTADVGGLMNGVEGLVKIDFEQKQGWVGWALDGTGVKGMI